MAENKGFQCYVCKKFIYQGHEYYWRMCKECGEFNHAMRERRVGLGGYIALVTGARIKIGYYTALKLLRDGATVIAATRFPMDAISRYGSEPDFHEWKERLFVCRLDLLRIDLLDSFIHYVNETFEYLDIIVNNAAQTIRKPDHYYAELMEREKTILPNPHIRVLEFGENVSSRINEELITAEQMVNPNAKEDNSWVLESGDISTKEFLEVQLINVTAPFMLTSKLKNMLMRSKNKNKFIINVSSVEGQFSQKKKSRYHVHTNMAKAALNMMTKTISKEYSRDRVFVYSVDPGWVSNQFPSNWSNLKNTDFRAPLDYEDAAARLCYPVYEWLNSEKPDEGLFLKDYRKIEW